MGLCHSSNENDKPNNPMDEEQYKRDKYEREYNRVERAEREQARKAEKLKRKQEKMASLKSPEAPHVPKKPDVCYSESDYNLEVKKRMQEQLAFDSQTFILNQLMLSVQFFENFEK